MTLFSDSWKDFPIEVETLSITFMTGATITVKASLTADEVSLIALHFDLAFQLMYSSEKRLALSLRLDIAVVAEGVSKRLSSFPVIIPKFKPIFWTVLLASYEISSFSRVSGQCYLILYLSLSSSISELKSTTLKIWPNLASNLSRPSSDLLKEMQQTLESEFSKRKQTEPAQQILTKT